MSSQEVSVMEISSKAVRKILAVPLIVGLSDGSLHTLEDGKSLELGAQVSSLASSPDRIVVGLASGKILYTEEMPFNELKDLGISHKQNVCSLDVCGNLVLSGSWDNQAILYDVETKKSSTYGHPGSVWVVKILDKQTFITGCSDGHIRIFSGSKVVRDIAWHTGPVRGILIKDKNQESLNINDIVIYSIDNHGTVHKTAGSGALLAARKIGGFFFCMSRWDSNIVVSGEPGVVFILSESLEVLKKIEILPNDLVWDLCCSDGNLYVCGNNGKIYILEKGKNDYLIPKFKSELTQTLEAAEKTGLTKEEERPKIFSSGGLRYKSEGGKIFVERNGEWELIGDEVEKWDYSFNVTLGNKQYMLSFNKSDNIHEVARKFRRKNQLGDEYHNEIVEFIKKHFKMDSFLKRYDTLNFDKVTKLISPHPILPIIKEVMSGVRYEKESFAEKNVAQIEKALLYESEHNLPLFVKLDICKYLVAIGIDVDLAYLIKIEPSNPKEAKAYMFLLTNLVIEPPFNPKVLEAQAKKLLDRGLLKVSDFDFFNLNKKSCSK